VIVLLVILLAPRQAVTGEIVNFRSARRLAAVVIWPEKVTTRAAEPVKVLYMEVSAYSPTVAECDGNPLRTASGKRVYVGGIAADLRVLPFGSIVIIPGYNGGEPCEVIDTGSAIKGAKLDVFLWSTDEAIHWGRRRNVRVQVLYVPRAAK
jgi:3D (Asp-Asp-Asp) domain-containing protein